MATRKTHHYKNSSMHLSRLEKEFPELSEDSASDVSFEAVPSEPKAGRWARIQAAWLVASPLVVLGLLVVVLLGRANTHVVAQQLTAPAAPAKPEHAPIPAPAPAPVEALVQPRQEAPAPVLPNVLDLYTCRGNGSRAPAALSHTALCALEPEARADYDIAEDRHLTEAQCDAAFPGLFAEVHRAAAFYKARGGLTEADLDAAEKKGQARALIYNNHLYVKSYANSQQGTRTKALLAAINDALLTASEPVPDIEFVIQSGDSGLVSGAPWVLARKESEESLTVMPDFGFYSWPEPGVNSFQEVRDKTRAYEDALDWADKTNKLFWRGSMMVNIRKELYTLAKYYTWGDVNDLDWADKSKLVNALLTSEQHCQYKFLAHVEGWAYSGRLKYLQMCRSVIVMHKLDYIQHFHHLFNTNTSDPQQNTVLSPGRDFDELPATMRFLLENDDVAKRIADNSYHFFRYWLSPASIDCYWRRLFHQWAEIQTFKPVLRKDTVSFNSFILLGKTHWMPY